jgi:hypothetical protein
MLLKSMQAGWPDEFVKKIAQNVAQYIFCQQLCLTYIYRGKVSPKISVIFNYDQVDEKSPNLATLVKSI